MYKVIVSDDISSETFEASKISEAPRVAEEWALGGEWGDDGAIIDVHYVVYDEAGAEVDSGWVSVEIPPNEGSLIVAAAEEAGLSRYDYCGTDPDDHDWTSEGEGGLRENPGVWSLGGTTVVESDHCRVCGLHRKWTRYGSQRNPGQADTVEYRFPLS